ncbi:MAG: hypothetical protein AB1668_05700 [Nanoarchaeota archaeon]
MGAEEGLIGVFVQWKSLILVLFVLGVEYIGLTFLEFLKKKQAIYNMTLYDKIIRSALLGFISFSIVILMNKIKITEQEDIFKLIGVQGLGLFLITTIICIAISFAVYVAFYYSAPNKNKNIKNRRKKLP